MNIFQEEIHKIQIVPDKIEQIRSKDGIWLFRIYKNNHSYVLKLFENMETAREIRYYKLLAEAGVPTVKLHGKTDRCILMEDLVSSANWRLGTENDLDDPSMAANLAQWYRTLHGASEQILSAQEHWYTEYGLLTAENLNLAAEKTGTAHQPIWQTLTDQLPALHRIIETLEPVVNYNDFYYTNLAVSKDGKQAIMFDYNYMGKGYRAADLRNVCSSLSERAAQAFTESYGWIPAYEYKADDVISTLTTLIMAAKQPQMPSWVQPSLEALKSGKLAADIRELISD